jgi:hemoglobin
MMTHARLGFTLVVLAFLPVSPAWAQGETLPRGEVDARVYAALRETITLGADIFNKNDAGGCYRLYQGALMAIAPLMDHRPDVKARIEKGLRRAETQPRVPDKAFTLREVIDEVRETLRKDLGPPIAGRGLWDRLGGEKAVKAVVHDFVVAAAKDPKVNFFRNNKFPLDAKGVANLEQLLVELVSSATGGPLKYTGRDMKEVHAGMKITDAEFNALAGHLIATLKKFNVPKKEIDELVEIVGSTRKDIVESKEPGSGATAKAALWDRLGGDKAVRLVVRDFVQAAAKDPKVNFTRNNKFPLDAKGVANLELLLIELISQVTGGPLKYTGRDMKEVHAGMKITEAEFNALAGHLIATLKKYNVPQKEIDELIGIVATTQKDIVER